MTTAWMQEVEPSPEHRSRVVLLFRENSCVGCDLEDIRAALRAQRGRLNMAEVQEYFVLFNRKEVLDELLAEIAEHNA